VAPELEPSIHVMRLDLAGASEASLWEGLSKSTRQRIRTAETTVTVREDTAGERLEGVAAVLRERADVLGIGLQEGTGYLRGWRALMEAGLARLLVAEHDGDLIGGLFIHVHGGIHATAYSADRADRRRDLPGAMHLVRWTAIRDALAAGAAAIELGGVDLPGHREPPRQGDPTWGLYEHKRSFGARWVERSPARRIVLRPWPERLARVRRAAVDVLRRVGR
jgi:lipid II:glycine glycyltransferase (peptidoglycan interpeptide bridge formation enzyme)